MPFVRFRVGRELGRGDVESAEGKDHVVEALRPVQFFVRAAQRVLQFAHGCPGPSC